MLKPGTDLELILIFGSLFGKFFISLQSFSSLNSFIVT